MSFVGSPQIYGGICSYDPCQEAELFTVPCYIPTTYSRLFFMVWSTYIIDKYTAHRCAPFPLSSKFFFTLLCEVCYRLSFFPPRQFSLLASGAVSFQFSFVIVLALLQWHSVGVYPARMNMSLLMASMGRNFQNSHTMGISSITMVCEEASPGTAQLSLENLYFLIFHEHESRSIDWTGWFTSLICVWIQTRSDPWLMVNYMENEKSNSF